MPLTAEDQEKLRRLNEGEEASDITNIEDERCLRFSDFLSSFAVSRIVLFQLIPYTAVWFNIAAELTSCPLFAAIDNDEQATKKNRYLPNLTYFADSYQDAKDMVDHNFNDPPHGLVFLLQMYLLFRKSRVITFINKFVVATAALVVNFIPEGLYIAAPILLAFLIYQGLMYSFYAILLVAKLLYPRQRPQNEDDVGGIDPIDLILRTEKPMRFF